VIDLRRACCILHKRYSRRRQSSPPVTPPGELDETYASSLIPAYSLHQVKRWRHPQNRKYTTYSTAVTVGSSHGDSWNFDEWFLRYASGQTNKQTDRQTDTLIIIHVLRTLTAGKVNIVVVEKTDMRPRSVFAVSRNIAKMYRVGRSGCFFSVILPTDILLLNTTGSLL